MSGFFDLIKFLLGVESDSDLILQGKCPNCEEEMDENDTYDGPDCYLCVNCRTGETDETL